MSLTFWKRLSFGIGSIALLILLGMTILVSNLEIKDVDLWLHIATGRFIVENLTVPNLDVLSFTINEHQWINHEWLFQVLIHFVYTFFGADGLISVRVIAVCLTLILLWMIGYNGNKRDAALFLLVLVLLNYMQRLMLRPDMFSLLFFILFIYTLAVQIDQRSSLLALFFIQLIWVNTHGFFIFGPLLVLIMIISEWSKRHVDLPYEWSKVGRYSDEEFKNLNLGFIVVLLACLINPYHIKGLLYPLGVLTSLSGESEIFFSHIKELEKPIEWANLFSLKVYPHYRWMIIISSVSFILNRKRLDIGMFLLWLILLIFSLSAIRNMIFFAVISFLVVLINLQHIRWKNFLSERLLRKKRWKYISLIFLKVCLIVWMLNFIFKLAPRGYFNFDTMSRKSEFGGITLKNYPYKAANFLVNNKVKGNFFNDFNSGAYLLGRTHPDIKVFMDGRTEVYGPEYFQHYMRIWRGDQALMNAAIDHYKITGAFLNSIRKPAPAKFIYHLYRDPKWKLVYFDFDAAIFLLDIPANKPWIDRFEVSFSNYAVPRISLSQIGTKKITPFPYTHRAQSLYNMREYALAAKEAQEALKISPFDQLALKILGKIDIVQYQYKTAFHRLRAALLASPNDMETRYYYAVSLFHLGDYKESRKHCERVLVANPNNNKGRALLSLILIKEGAIDQALSNWPKEEGKIFTIKEIIQELNPGQELLSILNSVS